MLSPQIKELIYQRFGEPVNSHEDYVLLAYHINRFSYDYNSKLTVRGTITADILKQLFNTSNNPIYPGAAHLNTIAQYLGYYQWDYLPEHETVAPQINLQYKNETKDWRKGIVKGAVLQGVEDILTIILAIIGAILFLNYVM